MTNEATIPAVDKLESLFQRHFSFSSFRPGQREVMQLLLDGHSSAAVFPTGGGKSLCYQLPALAFSGTTIVVSPLIALMKDQIDALTARGIAAIRLDSTLTPEQYSSAQQRLRDGKIKLLYVSPERFNNERFRELLLQLDVALFAVDEAHCISEWGHNFRPDYLKLVRFAEMCQAQRRLALTATATEHVLDDICREFGIRAEHAVKTPFYRSNLHIKSVQVDDAHRDAELIKRLSERPAGPTIVYVTLQKSAESVAAMLASYGLPARAYHAGMDKDVGMKHKNGFSARITGSLWRRSLSGWVSTNQTSGTSTTTIYPRASRITLRKLAGPAAMANSRSAKPCSAGTISTHWRISFTATHPRVIPSDHCWGIFLLATKSFRSASINCRGSTTSATLVVRTLLTYLELDDYLQGGTPYYAEYQFKPKLPSHDILAHFAGERQAFVASMLRCARQAKTWFHIDVDRAAAATQSDRARVVRALDYLADRDWFELRTGQLHHRYRRLRIPDSLDQLADALFARASRREQQELDRLRQLVDLMTAKQCQAAALAEYFGERLEQPCGHCAACVDDSRKFRSRSTDAEERIPDEVWTQVSRLQSDQAILQESVSLARLLCGITTPATTAAKLHRHELFGCCSAMPFQTVRDQAEQQLNKI